MRYGFLGAFITWLSLTTGIYLIRVYLKFEKLLRSPEIDYLPKHRPSYNNYTIGIALTVIGLVVGVITFFTFGLSLLELLVNLVEIGINEIADNW